MQLRPASTGDVSQIEQLLRANELPTVGVRESIQGFVVALEGAMMVGAIGVEPCGPRFGLLRSAVVNEKWRGKGVGRDLVERVIGDSRKRGLEALYLLTTTAEDYFPGFGFSRTTREAVPAEVKATEEFREACPESATVMALRLD